MSARTLSPTASLLRTSRLFSLPPPLAKPALELGFAPNSTSDSATLPFPTHAAIETTESGLARGDWGLKRPFPLKSTTRSSTPCVQIDNIDSIDHITDFRSAAPYSRTLKKWQEIGIPVSKYRSNNKGLVKSAFESNEDYTCKVQSPSSQRRWRFEGPWLANLTEEEYLSYLHHKVKNRRSEFRRFLQDAIPKERYSRLKKTLRERGESEAAVTTLEDQHQKLSETDLDMEIRALRKDPKSLDQYMASFLDLPRNTQSQDNGSPPPSTHPSAGLSYQRSHAHTANHPLYGPQEFKVPVEARVLLPQRDARNFRRAEAVLGVGGIATADNRKAALGENKEHRSQVSHFSSDGGGGPRIWVHVNEAAITPEGRIQLQTSRAESPAIEAIGRTDGSATTQMQRSGSPEFEPLTEMPDLHSGHPRRKPSSSGYGLTLDNVPQSQRAKPIDTPLDSLLDLIGKKDEK